MPKLKKKSNKHTNIPTFIFTRIKKIQKSRNKINKGKRKNLGQYIITYLITS